MKYLITTIAALVLVGCGNSEANQALLDAAEFGNVKPAKEAIEDGADVNAKNVDGWSPLHRAASWGHKEIAELLIAKGADVNAKAAGGWAPLHLAAYKGQNEIVELLIAKGANVNAKNDIGETPLDFAIQLKSTETFSTSSVNTAARRVKN